MSIDTNELSETISDAFSENFATNEVATGRLNVTDGLFAIAHAITYLGEKVAVLNVTLEKKNK